jgi:sulfotransferase
MEASICGAQSERRRRLILSFSSVAPHFGLYKGTWGEFFECFLRGQIVYGSWFDHTLVWWTNIQESPENVLVLHYEDMKHDFATQIHRIGAFLGKDLSPRAVAAIAEHGEFQRMSANPFTNREGHPRMDFSIRRPPRKGEVGDRRNHFTNEQNERFKAVWDQRMGGTVLAEYFDI